MVAIACPLCVVCSARAEASSVYAGDGGGAAEVRRRTRGPIRLDDRPPSNAALHARQERHGAALAFDADTSTAYHVALKVPLPCAPDQTAPSARPVPSRAQAAPTHPGVPF